MNYQQLEYIVAVDRYRHFVTASQKCFVTQPTLSMMIKKLEDELDILIFDRSKQPVVPTEIGEKIIRQANIVITEMKKIPLISEEMKGKLEGDLRIGIIPTIAPYLIPVFLYDFNRNYPGIKLIINEITTDEIIARLIKGDLDCGILATPLRIPEILEHPVYYEEFLLYASSAHSILRNKLVSAELLEHENLWLLHESHCLRNQIINFCDIKNSKIESTFNYEVGSIETLRKLVDHHGGMTILPELAVEEFDDETKKRTRHFTSPGPSREVSIVTYRHFLKDKMIGALKSMIREKIPQKMLTNEGLYVTPVFQKP